MAADYSHFLKSSEKRRKECQESCTEFVFGMGESRVMFRWAPCSLYGCIACACDTDVREKILSKPSNFLTNGFYICDLLLLIKLWHVHVIWIWKQLFLDTYNAVQCISCLELLWRIFVKQIKESLKLRVNETLLNRCFIMFTSVVWW